MEQQDEPTPQEWVRRAQRGDAVAFAELIRRYERTALAVAYSTVGDASAAGDVTQEAMLKAWQRLGDLKQAEKFGPWLCSMVRNLAVDARRRVTKNTTSIEDSMAFGYFDPAAEMMQREATERIDAALGRLDATTRTAVVLRYYEGLGATEIGTLLDLSAAAVDMRLSRARGALRTLLADEAPAGAERMKVR